MTTAAPIPDDQLLSLFPPSAEVRDGELTIAGCSATELAAKHGTPLYVYDESALRARARQYADGLQARWSNSMVTWASKSAPCTALYRVMAEEGLGVDVAGGGELVMALAGGVPPERIVMHGNAKTTQEIALAVDANVGLIVIDNFDDIDRLERTVPDEQGVLVRVRPDIEANTYDAVATGHSRSKFGLPLADARRAIARLRSSTRLRLDGVHAHVGSQIFETDPFRRAVEVVSSLGDFPVYNVGGGLGIRYTAADEPAGIDEYLDVITDAARAALPASSRLLIEPGRSMVASAGVTLYRVISVKRNTRTFVAVDGGMGDNLEVALFGQRFEATLANRVGSRGEESVLVGRHCESGDFLADPVYLRDPEVGDLIAVAATGAYCLPLSNNYNGARKPPVVFAHGGQSREVVRRETYGEMLGRDVESASPVVDNILADERIAPVKVLAER